MKLPKISSMVVTAALTLLPAAVHTAEWLTDVPAAQAKAAAENKLVLLDFTGSDWCGWCMRLKAEVFSQKEFEAFARENLVLVEIDFPHRTAQTAELKRANEALARQFGIQGYPTIILLDHPGRRVGQLGYMPGGPGPFIAEIQKLSGMAPPPAAAKAQAERPPVPMFSGAPTLPPPQFNGLILKGISGPKDHRLAMINNQTLGAGESVTLKLAGSPVKLRCLEIRDKSVIVALNGREERRELRLHDGP